METIQSFILPDTFPPILVPEATGQFLLSLVGETLSEALFLASIEGLDPRTGPLPNRPADFREFSIVVDGLFIPFGCRLNT